MFDLRGVIDQTEYIRQSPAIENPVSRIPNVFHLPFFVEQESQISQCEKNQLKKIVGDFLPFCRFRDQKKDSNDLFL